MLGNSRVEGNPVTAAIRRIGSHLRGNELFLYCPGLIAIPVLMALLSVPRRKHCFARAIQAPGTYPQYNPGKLDGTCRNILDIYDSVRVREEQ
jgi:hypothetical protein